MDLTNKQKEIIEDIVKEELKKRNKHQWLYNGLRVFFLSLGGSLLGIYTSNHNLTTLILSILFIIGATISYLIKL